MVLLTGSPYVVHIVRLSCVDLIPFQSEVFVKRNHLVMYINGRRIYISPFPATHLTVSGSIPFVYAYNHERVNLQYENCQELCWKMKEKKGTSHPSKKKAITRVAREGKVWVYISKEQLKDTRNIVSLYIVWYLLYLMEHASFHVMFCFLSKLGTVIHS